MATRVRRTPRTNEIWPGFVDALSTLLMVIIFLLVVLMLAQYFLSVTLSGRNEALEKLTREVNELAELLSLEHQANAELRLDIAQLSAELQSSTASRDGLTARLNATLAERDDLVVRLSLMASERDKFSKRTASLTGERDAYAARLQAMTAKADAARAETDAARAETDIAKADVAALRAALAEANKLVETEREVVKIKLAELVALRRDIEALRALRAELEGQISQLAAVAADNADVLARLEKDNAALDERYRVVLIQLGDTKLSLADTERSLADRRAAVADLDERNRILVIGLSDAAATLATSQAAKDSLEEKLRLLAAGLVDSEAALADSRAATAEIDERNRILVIRLDDAATALADSRSALAKSDGERRVLMLRLDDVAVALAASQSAAAALDTDLTAVRDHSKALEARLSDAAERTALAQREIEDREYRIEELSLALRQSDQELSAQVRLTASAEDKITMLSLQIAALREQLNRIAAALEVSEAANAEKNVVIANLGKRLNEALATKVAELQRYRSEFFGRLREVIGNQQGVKIVDDRFVFQSEVLFESASAEIGEDGKLQLGLLADTLLEIATRIPADIAWVLRVDGHTDNEPIHTELFASNWELSTARAISVVRFLIEQGVPAGRLVAAGFGEFQPIEERDDEIGRRRNRRIELKLTNR